jgi:hypothetical protein
VCVTNEYIYSSSSIEVSEDSTFGCYYLGLDFEFVIFSPSPQPDTEPVAGGGRRVAGGGRREAGGGRWEVGGGRREVGGGWWQPSN